MAKSGQDESSGVASTRPAGRIATISAAPRPAGPGSAAPTAPAASRSWAEPAALFAILVVAIVATGIAPAERRAWILELAPVFVGVPVMVATRRRFPMTSLAYRLAFLLSLLLVVGGYFTYSHVPLGFWLERTLHLSRNPYDRIVHFASGVAAAILARELVRRKTNLSPPWVFTVVTLGCLAGAAAYELLEWAAAMIMGGGARDFLATQGDRWDTQWDMFTTFCGAILSLLVLGGYHERRMQDLLASHPEPRVRSSVTPRPGA
jgi:putative membrane protein